MAVVSGGGKGLGRSFCLALARQGARVVVTNHNPAADAAGRVVAEIAAAGGEAVADYGDAADPASGEAMVAAAMERWGRLDICVANAAIGTAGMFHKQGASEFDRVVDVNLLGSARLARAAMAVMRPAGFGRIILVASAGGLQCEQDRGLQAVGVLVFVDKHVIEATADIGGDGRIRHHLSPVKQQVVVIEDVLLLLGLGVCRE